MFPFPPLNALLPSAELFCHHHFKYNVACHFIIAFFKNDAKTASHSITFNKWHDMSSGTTVALAEISIWGAPVLTRVRRTRDYALVPSSSRFPDTSKTLREVEGPTRVNTKASTTRPWQTFISHCFILFLGAFVFTTDLFLNFLYASL